MAAACGSPAPAPILVRESPRGAYEVSLASAPNGYMAAWYDMRHGHGEIYVQRLDVEGRPAAPEHRLTTGTVDSYEADVAGLDDRMIVAWYERTSGGALTPRLGAWSYAGTLQWSEQLAAAGRNTIVRARGGLVFVAWIQDEGRDRAGVWGGWWRTNGDNVIAARRLADAGPTTWNLNAAIDPAASPGRPRAWVVFDARVDTAREELFLVDTDARTDRVARLTRDDGFASKYPDLAVDGDRVALTWFDSKDGNEEVYLAVGGSSMIEKGLLPTPRRVTRSPGQSIGAYLAWSGGRLGLAWCDDTSGNPDLYFQAFDRVGEPLSRPVHVSDAPTAASVPSIRASRRGFAVLWGEDETPTQGGHVGGGRSRVMFSDLPQAGPGG